MIYIYIYYINDQLIDDKQIRQWKEHAEINMRDRRYTEQQRGDKYNI